MQLKTPLPLAFLFIFLPILTGIAEAHHTGQGTGTSGTKTTFYQGTRARPSSRISATYDLAQIDNTVGQLHTWILGGEWAVHKRFGFLGIIPVAVMGHNFKENATGLGDLALGGNYLFLNRGRFFALVSSLWSFPTGDDQKGLGLGGVGQQINLFGGVETGSWVFFLNPGVSFGYAPPREPTLGVGVGVVTPKIQERIYFSLTANSQFFLESDVFKNGSWKLSLEPQVNWVADGRGRLTLSLSGRMTLIDNLSRKDGVVLTNTSNALLNDVLWGLSLSASYSF